MRAPNHVLYSHIKLDRYTKTQTHILDKWEGFDVSPPNRFQLAWGVLTGKYDALEWDGV